MKISEPSTLQQLLRRAAELEVPTESGADADAGLRFLDRRERPTFHGWRSIFDQATRVAAGLRSVGLEAGDRVALVYPTCPELIHGLFGVLAAGAVPVPLYPPVRLGRLDEYHERTARMLQAVGARLVLVDAKVSKLLGPTCEKAETALGFRTLDGLMPPGDASFFHEGVETEAALIQFSSGTTVDPKPVCLSQRAVLAQVRTLNGFWPDDPASGWRHSGVTWLPLYHDMGLIGCVFPALERPGTLTLIGPEVFVARPAIWLRALSRWRATISVAPNFAYALCVRKIDDRELDGVDLSAWRIALNGAEPVAPDVLRAFQRRFAEWGFRPGALTPVYGLSEATLAVTFSDLSREFTSTRFNRQALTEGWAVPDPEGREAISVGRPLPGTRVFIEVDDASPEGHEGAGVPIGRILVEGPSVMDGYWDRPEATAETLRDGRLDTGDLGFLWQDDLYVVGRAKDVLILRGRNHSPVDVEQAIGAVPGLRPGCAVAASFLPENADGERLLLFVERSREAGAGPTAPVDGELQSACENAALVACGLRVDEVLILEPGTLPRTSSGKLRRGETLRRYLAGSLDAPSEIGPLRLAGELVRSSLAYRRARRRSTKP